MEFLIDKDLRRRCSFKIIGATTGGKIALTLCGICTVLFPISLVLMVSYGAAFLNTDDEATFIKLFCSIFAFGTFLMAGPVGLVCTYRQRNLNAAMRTRERLVLEGGWLRYSFRLSNDRDCYGLDDIAINLRECSLQRGANGECVFTGGVFRWHYEDATNDSPRSPDEMTPTPSFEIWPYWSPDLHETLVAEQRRLAFNREEATTTENKKDRETYLYRGSIEEPANTPTITSRTERAFVEVGKKPRPLVAFAWWFVVLFVVLTAMWSLSRGNLVGLVVLTLVPHLRGLAKRAGAATKTQIVWVTISVSEENVTIDMPGGRLYNGEYVDQRYVCDRALIDCIVCDEQVFRLQARSMQSIVSRAGTQLAVENLAYTEVSFRLDATGRERIGRLLAENGYAAPSSVG